MLLYSLNSYFNSYLLVHEMKHHEIFFTKQFYCSYMSIYSYLRITELFW